MANPDNYPMLVHCQHGVTRTSMFLTAYDVIYRHKTAERVAGRAADVRPRPRADVHVHAFAKNFEQFVNESRDEIRPPTRRWVRRPMTASKPRISVCIPHWQAQLYMTLCLRSIRKHSAKYDLEVIVVDNGSRDGSLAYLRIRPLDPAVERPEETPANWPLNVFTAWDRGLRLATGEFYLTMHSDVFVKSDDWLAPFLRELSAGPEVAATGSWKLELENPLYAWQKRTVGYAVAKTKSILGLGKRVRWQQQNYPRDYCALYRRQAMLDHDLTFCPVNGCTGGGYSIARQLWDAGFSTPLFPVREMAGSLYHIAHGTAAIAPEKRLNHARKQKQTERKLAGCSRRTGSAPSRSIGPSTSSRKIASTRMRPHAISSFRPLRPELARPLSALLHHPRTSHHRAGN